MQIIVNFNRLSILAFLFKLKEKWNNDHCCISEQIIFKPESSFLLFLSQLIPLWIIIITIIIIIVIGIIIIIIILLLGFHWSLSDNKSLQISRTFLSILTTFNCVAVGDLDSSSDFWFPQSDLYYHHLHVPYLCQFSGKVKVIFSSFYFLLFSFSDLLEWKNLLVDKSISSCKSKLKSCLPVGIRQSVWVPKSQVCTYTTW